MRAEATAWLLGGLRVRTCVVFGTDLVGGGSPSLASASGSGTVSYTFFFFFWFRHFASIGARTTLATRTSDVRIAVRELYPERYIFHAI